MGLFVLDSEVVHDERLYVGVLVDDFRHGLAVAVPCVDIDTDELHRRPGVRRLQRRGVLEGMGGHHAVVVVAGGDHDGRIVVHAVADRVKR